MPYYTGYGLPDHNSNMPRIKHDIDLLRDSVHSILCSCKGQRLFLPDFGSLLCTLIFEPNDEISRTIAEETIREALTKWEPRVQLVGVQVTSDENTMRISVDMVERRMRIPFNLPLTITKDMNRNL